MPHHESEQEGVIPRKSVVRFALWAAVVGLAFGAYLTYTYLQTA